MSTKEEQDILRRLVQHVSRAFYESATVVAMDQLARHTVLKEDDLAGRIGMQSKDLHKVMAKLTKPGLVKEHRQNELKEGAQRSSSKSYYYIDYTHFCNVVKWRVAEMRRTVDKTLRNELDNKGYVCPQCKKTFTALDVAFLHDPIRNGLFCDVCHMEVTSNEDAEAVRGSKDRMERFNRQMRFITAGLRASEGMVMPNFDVATYVKQHLVQSEAERQEKLGGGQAATGGAGGKGDRELQIAGANGSGIKEEGISIVMSGGIDEERARAERDKAAEAKKVQNALPAWHLQSTITGDLTSLGVAEQARAAAAAAQSAALAASSSGDDALRGLGTVNGRIGDTKMESMISMSEDVKVGTDSTPDYYDDYYASLAAGTQSRSTPTSGVPDDYSRDEEVDVKPNVQLLDSLGDYRKRARSPSAHEDEPPAKKFSQDSGPAPTATSAGELEVAQESEDDPTVYVNGEAMPYSAVTEEHHDLMTPDEYTAYFEIASTRM